MKDEEISIYWSDRVALRLRFAAVLQGGGIRGLFFPGHIVGLFRSGIGKVFAFGGASAGALVAVGIWAGLHPAEFNRFLESRCGRLGLVRSMFSISDLIAVPLTWALTLSIAPISFLLKRTVRFYLVIIAIILWEFD